MKISTLFTTLLMISLATLTQAQTTYNITANRTWQNNNNSAYPSNCVKCTFNISSGVTLTIDRNVTCQSCTFNGGDIKMDNNTLTLQTNTNYFNNTTFTTTNNSKIQVSAPIKITNSVFTLKDKTEFNPQQLIELTNSRINLYGKSFFNATGGPVNLKDNSGIMVGDGTLASTAYVYINGPQLNIYDYSAVVLSNHNNYYFNWNNYYGAATNTSYSTKVNTMNCGSGYPHTCSMPYLWGRVSLTGTGVLNYDYLPVKLTNFEVKPLNNNTIVLTWKTQQEANSDYFSIERSTDGLTWKQVGQVAAKGNSTIVVAYAFTDATPAAGTAHYRLKMVDLDNTFMYSEIKTVRSGTIKNVSVYPNPTHDVVNVSVTNNAKKVLLIQMSGQIMQEKAVTGNAAIISFPVQTYAAGSYMVQVINEDGTRENKMVLINK